MRRYRLECDCELPIYFEVFRFDFVRKKEWDGIVGGTTTHFGFQISELLGFASLRLNSCHTCERRSVGLEVVGNGLAINREKVMEIWEWRKVVKVKVETECRGRVLCITGRWNHFGTPTFTPLFRSWGCKGLVVKLVADRRVPIVSLSILLSYFYRRKNNPEGSKTQPYFLTWRLFIAGAIIGVLLGVDNYLYSSGAGKLPVSTSSLLLSTQLAFTAIFAFIIVKQKFTSYSVNSVVLLIVASLILGLHASSDRPNQEPNKTYYAGFFLTLGAAVLYGIILPMIELMYKKANQNITYYFVMEMQLVISIFATAFCTVGMLVNRDFQGILKEAREYELGEAKYYLVLVATAVVWQCFLLGVAGVIFSSSSLLSGIMIAVLLPVTKVLAVIFFHEDFKVEKGIALVLSIWGFISYFYGEFKQSKKEKPTLNLKQNGSTT
ncbi:hypothetical protein GIB67_011695 [Kingdonia uniflora]|uniref:Probable purine permease n=1 Tax=Kingdonia uniflora TaxID=39325 RepID=A0A7J7LU90_9MAGN|nr:hypothetical protein GIB67_011695 [Kingdonia uniflora]